MADAAVAREPAGNRSNLKSPLVWLLMGNRVGDNNQLLALAGALGFPFETKKLDFNQARHIPFLRTGLKIVASHSRRIIAPPWPDIIIGSGYGSVPVARYIRERTGGRAKLVHIGNPRGKIEDFDLQISTPQYPCLGARNLLELPFPIGNPARDAVVSIEDRDWLLDYPRPRRLVAVGGPARHWQLDHRALAEAIGAINCKAPSGSLIAVTSNRTDKATRRLLERLVNGPGQAVLDHRPTFGTLLSECDEIYVTADSVSMLSEAILTAKPVGMIPIERSLRGKISHWLWERRMGRSPTPDFGRFWDLLRRHEIIGTVENPVASRVPDTVDRAANAVRSVFSAGDSSAKKAS